MNLGLSIFRLRSSLGVLVFALSPFICFQRAMAAASPITCAIRWDAWYTNGANDPGHFTAAALSKPEWRSRAPLHAHFDSSGRIVWAPTQDTFDAEIRAAANAHLCWAYLSYGSNGKIAIDDPMMRGLLLHRASRIKDEVKYSLIIQGGIIGTPTAHDDSVNQIVGFLLDSNYQQVTVNGHLRPLLFFFYDTNDMQKRFGGVVSGVKNILDDLRAKSKKAGLGDPYLVILAAPASTAEKARNELGGDAISEYIAGQRNGQAMSWSEFEPSIERDWDQYAQVAAAAVVPTLRSGADIRARCETPPPFDHRFKAGDPCQNYTVNPTSAELVREFINARTWLENHASKDPARLLLVYAWSECDESGNCLMPTYGDPGGQKLRAIAAALR